MKRTRYLPFFVVAAFVLALLVTGDQEQPRATAPPRDDVHAGMPGHFQAHIDTITGEFVDGPDFTLEELPPEVQDALSTSTTGLVEEAAPGGGTMVRLNGRFSNMWIGGRDASGSAVANCVAIPPVEVNHNADEDTARDGEEGSR